MGGVFPPPPSGLLRLLGRGEHELALHALCLGGALGLDQEVGMEQVPLAERFGRRLRATLLARRSEGDAGEDVDRVQLRRDLCVTLDDLCVTFDDQSLQRFHVVGQFACL